MTEYIYRKEQRPANKVLPQWGLTCFYETFVLKQTAVLLLSFGAKNPPLRQYPNRCVLYHQATQKTSDQ